MNGAENWDYGTHAAQGSITSFEREAKLFYSLRNVLQLQHVLYFYQLLVCMYANGDNIVGRLFW